jgi:hypothetical protein
MTFGLDCRAMRVTLLILFLASCAADRDAWRRDGACAVVCDYRTGYLSAARTVSPFTCRCITPELATINEQHSIPLAAPAGTIHCCGGCVAEAEAILKRQPWRRQYPEPFDDPLRRDQP